MLVSALSFFQFFIHLIIHSILRCELRESRMNAQYFIESLSTDDRAQQMYRIFLRQKVSTLRYSHSILIC